MCFYDNAYINLTNLFLFSKIICYNNCEIDICKTGEYMKTVLITGASRGIGRATAIKFAKNGYNIVINYNKNEKKAISLQKELSKYNVRTLINKADISDEKQVKNMVELAYKTFGKINVLVNNAGIDLKKQIQDYTLAEIQKLFDVNTIGSILVTREVSKLMISEKSGKIVNISSIWGKVGGSMESVYSASKGSIISLTLALAKELAPSGININCICPGVIDTDMMKGYSTPNKKELADLTPLNRLGKAEDIANAVYFLASEESSFITGQILTVDGGFTL